MDLYNRNYFIEKLEHMIVQKKPDETLAVIFIDLDRFKAINDSYEHDMRDSVLKTVSIRLSSLVSEDMVLARLGGDEFAIARTGMFTNADLEQFIGDIIRSCEEPITIAPHCFNISLSVGIATTRVCEPDRGVLMKNADIAMHDAKEDLNKKYSFYNETLNKNKGIPEIQRGPCA